MITVGELKALLASVDDDLNVLVLHDSALHAAYISERDETGNDASDCEGNWYAPDAGRCVVVDIYSDGAGGARG